MKKTSFIISLLAFTLNLIHSQSTTILTEGFENASFPAAFSKDGNLTWNPGTPGVTDYQGTFWDNLYCSTSSSQKSEISTTEVRSGSQSLKLTLTTDAQLLSPKLRSKENTLPL